MEGCIIVLPFQQAEVMKCCKMGMSSMRNSSYSTILNTCHGKVIHLPNLGSENVYYSQNKLHQLCYYSCPK